MVCSFVSIYFDSPQLEIQKKKLYKTLDYWSRDMLNFNFPEKCLGLASPPHFVYNFWRKMFPKLYSISWLNFIVWLSLLLETLSNMRITIVCWPGCNIIKFETNFIFLIKSFCCKTKKSRQKFKYLENEKSFWGEIKSTFHHFQRAFNCQKLSQTWKCAFNLQIWKKNIESLSKKYFLFILRIIIHE